MANYKSSGVTGDSYIRCVGLAIRNPKNEVPTVDFFEERYYDLDSHPVGVPINKRFYVEVDMGSSFDILDANGMPTGTIMNVSDMYTYLYSYYIDQAIKRDVKEAELASMYTNIDATNAANAAAMEAELAAISAANAEALVAAQAQVQAATQDPPPSV